MTDTILVGIDGSHASIAALHWAVAEADHRAVRVRAVTTYLPQGHMVRNGTSAASQR